MQCLRKNQISHFRECIVMLGFALLSVNQGHSLESMIAFTSNRDNLGGNPDIFIMMADGSAPRNLTNNLAYRDLHPNWSPDGRKIAFESHREDGSDVYVIGADGKNLVQLTKAAESDGHPSWSPDGLKIAFTSRRNGNFTGPFFLLDLEIFVMDAHGENVVRLTQSPGWDSDPSWSPDGKNIAFRSVRDRDYEICIMDADGRNVVRLTQSPGWDGEPSWSPDGTKIAFASSRDGNAEIYVMDADGGNQINLTQNTASDSKPAWSPGRLAVSPKARLITLWAQTKITQ